jgi:hypothetical protein
MVFRDSIYFNCGYSLMVKFQPSTLAMWVRFPLPALRHEYVYSEDALVINEGCAGDIVKSAIIASKADATLANQIVQTASSVAPKQIASINDAASSVVPGLVASAPAAPGSYLPEEQRPATVANGKNPGKEPIEPVAPPPVEDDFFVPSTIRGIFLIQPPASGPLPPPPTTTIPVSPSVAG